MAADDTSTDARSSDSYNLTSGGDPYNLNQTSGVASSSPNQNNGSSTGGSSTTQEKPDKDGLPSFDSGKTYLVKGKTLNQFVKLIKRNRPKTVTGGGIKVSQETQDGTFLAIDAQELVLSVCINGVATSKTFYVKPSSSG